MASRTYFAILFLKLTRLKRSDSGACRWAQRCPKAGRYHFIIPFDDILLALFNP
jgi:hypothetical protein